MVPAWCCDMAGLKSIPIMQVSGHCREDSGPPVVGIAVSVPFVLVKGVSVWLACRFFSSVRWEPNLLKLTHIPNAGTKSKPPSIHFYDTLWSNSYWSNKRSVDSFLKYIEDSYSISKHFASVLTIINHQIIKR